MADGQEEYRFATPLDLEHHGSTLLCNASHPQFVTALMNLCDEYVCIFQS